MKRKVAAKKSRLHGRGLFAARDLKAGERLIEYKGIRYDKGKYPEIGDDNVTKFLGLSDGSAIDSAGWAALASHSCDPNYELQEEMGRNGRSRARLFALRDIQAGEELLWDYRLDIRSRKAAFTDWACACGADNCRGTMADSEKSGVVELVPTAAFAKRPPRASAARAAPSLLRENPAFWVGRAVSYTLLAALTGIGGARVCPSRQCTSRRSLWPRLRRWYAAFNAFGFGAVRQAEVPPARRAPEGRGSP